MVKKDVWMGILVLSCVAFVCLVLPACCQTHTQVLDTAIPTLLNILEIVL